MRRIALLAALCLLAGACGDDTAATTTTDTSAPPGSTTEATTTTEGATTSSPSTTTTTTAASTTTGTTYPWATFAVPEADHCVIEHRSGETLNVRSGPGTTFSIVGTLSFDQTGVHATGVAANDGDSRMWLEIDYYGGLAWVASWLLTPNPCTVAAPANYCVTGTSCLDRLNVRSGPGATYQKLGSLTFDEVGVQATGASSPDADGRDWYQIHFRGDIGWVASWFLTPYPCSPSTGSPCTLPSGAPSPGCVNGWTTPAPGSSLWVTALELIGVGGPWSEVDSAAFVVERMRYCVGPEDADITAPRPDVERWYIVGYAETNPDYRGRWIVRRTTVGSGVAAVAPYGSTGFGAGIWESCPDGCIIGPPIAGRMCDPGCGEDPQRRPCTGITPGTWSPGDCTGLPPEVLACFG